MVFFSFLFQLYLFKYLLYFENLRVLPHLFAILPYNSVLLLMGYTFTSVIFTLFSECGAEVSIDLIIPGPIQTLAWRLPHDGTLNQRAERILHETCRSFVCYVVGEIKLI